LTSAKRHVYVAPTVDLDARSRPQRRSGTSTVDSTSYVAVEVNVRVDDHVDDHVLSDAVKNSGGVKVSS
jgi:hypothetical protein